MKWHTQKRAFFVSQYKYILNLLKEARKLGCKLVETPIEANHKLGEALEDKGVDWGVYQRLVGQLIYLSHIRLDNAYAVSNVLKSIAEVCLEACSKEVPKKLPEALKKKTQHMKSARVLAWGPFEACFVCAFYVS